MLQVSTLAGTISQYPSQVLNPPLMPENILTLPAAETTQVSQANRVVVVNEEKKCNWRNPFENYISLIMHE